MQQAQKGTPQQTQIPFNIPPSNVYLNLQPKIQALIQEETQSQLAQGTQQPGILALQNPIYENKLANNIIENMLDHDYVNSGS